MSGLNIKVTAFMLFSILVVQGKIFKEDRYLKDANHVESYHRLYSDNDGSDIFDDSNSKLHFDVLRPEIEDHKELPYLSPGSDDRHNWEDTINGIIRDLEVGDGLPNIFPVDKRFDQDQPRPVWTPNDKDRPSLFPGGNNEGRNNYPINKPGRRQMKKKCQNIKGLPTPDSGCCGIQMTSECLLRKIICI